MLIYRRVDPSVNIDHVTSAMIPQKLRESIEVYQAKLDEQAKAVREADEARRKHFPIMVYYKEDGVFRRARMLSCHESDNWGDVRARIFEAFALQDACVAPRTAPPPPPRACTPARSLTTATAHGPPQWHRDRSVPQCARIWFRLR